MAKDISNLERMESRSNTLSIAYGRDSNGSGGENSRRKFSNAPAEAAGVRKYEGMVAQPNERWGAQIYKKSQQVWPGTFNEEDKTAKAIAAFKLGGRDAITELKPQLEIGHLETRLLTVHSKGQIVDISMHDYEEEPCHSKNLDRFRCSETDQEKEENYFKGSNRICNPGSGEDDKKASSCPREHMFEKTVTSSDVGKLNRLVIPKQHAEKYFPLDKDANEKGMLLNFEDSTGKTWRFRYSYWNSSQSYVLTKGWSRFVKEKKLDAGDIVYFDRSTYQDPYLVQRLFIGCKRKLFSTAQPPGLPGSNNHPLKLSNSFQFLSSTINNIGGSNGQQIISSRALIAPWMPLSCAANHLNNVGGESSRGVVETRALHMNALPKDLCSTTQYCGRHTMDTEISVREARLHTMQLKDPRSSGDNQSWPVKNQVEATVTSFDHAASTSKQVVRLFGVDLECGKGDGNYKDDLNHIIPPSERRFPRNSKYHHSHGICQTWKPSEK